MMMRFLVPVLVLGALSLLSANMIDEHMRAPAAVRTVQKPQTALRLQKPADTRTVVIPSENGHFAAEARVDGRPVAFMVDTGASLITLRESEASRLGYRPRDNDYTVRVSTANGEGRAAAIELSTVEVGEIMLRDVPALVVPDDALSVNLLGMSFLSRVRWQYERGQLVLEQ
jgi:aspartyl protease family protein